MAETLLALTTMEEVRWTAHGRRSSSCASRHRRSGSERRDSVMIQETGRIGGGACTAADPVIPTPLLIVEDDDGIATITSEILINVGYSVTRAASPSDTLALFALHGPRAYALVLSDAFSRDRAQAYAWFDRLRTVTMAPIVIWSAAPRVFYADYRARGYAGFLSKPFDIHDLLLMASLARNLWVGL